MDLGINLADLFFYWIMGVTFRLGAGNVLVGLALILLIGVVMVFALFKLLEMLQQFEDESEF